MFEWDNEPQRTTSLQNRWYEQFSNRFEWDEATHLPDIFYVTPGRVSQNLHRHWKIVVYPRFDVRKPT